ncbi:hypothetical protein NKDENANG_03154 [Candidatus Entotheonellaceae bacterium PAL068K]
MKRHSPPPQEEVWLDLDPVTFKRFLRDLLFREAGKPYFKRLAIPRRRLLSAWQTLSTYRAERQLLPVGGRQTDQLIRQFFTTHTCLQAEFQEGGMPVAAIYVLHQHCPAHNAALEQIQLVECTLNGAERYRLHLMGGPRPPAAPGASTDDSI